MLSTSLEVLLLKEKISLTGHRLFWINHHKRLKQERNCISEILSNRQHQQMEHKACNEAGSDALASNDVV